MREFLVCYDYGQGGIWLYLDAESPFQIANTYPDLTVFEKCPPFWNEEMEKAARNNNANDPFWSQWLKKLER